MERFAEAEAEAEGEPDPDDVEDQLTARPMDRVPDDGLVEASEPGETS